MTTAINFSSPVASDNYLTLLATLRTMIGAAASNCDTSQYTTSNMPTGAKRWNASTNFFQTYNGSSWSNLALKATYDADGNTISSTYAKSSALSSYVTSSALSTALSNYAALSGATFTGTVKFSNGKSNTDYALLSGATFTGTVTFSNGKTIANYALLSGATFTGGVKCTTTALSGSAIDLSTGNCFPKTVSAATTFSISNASGCSCFSLVLTNGGNYTVTWPSSVKWASGSPPSLTSGGIDVLTFISPNGGTTWYGVASLTEAS